jgi:hypothetical protein
MIPNRQADALNWMLPFSSGIQASPVTYMLQSADATKISSAVNTFASALSEATNPSTRTKGTIAAKDAAYATARQICGDYARVIKVDVRVSNQAKQDIGITPPKPGRTPQPPPDSAPSIAVIGATVGTHTLKYVGADGVEKIQKPRGVTNIEIYRVVADEPVTDENLAVFYSAYRRNPIGVIFDHAADGKVATYFARWADAKGQRGPWSLPTSMRVAA